MAVIAKLENWRQNCTFCTVFCGFFAPIFGIFAANSNFESSDHHDPDPAGFGSKFMGSRSRLSIKGSYFKLDWFGLCPSIGSGFFYIPVCKNLAAFPQIQIFTIRIVFQNPDPIFVNPEQNLRAIDSFCKCSLKKGPQIFEICSKFGSNSRIRIMLFQNPDPFHELIRIFAIEQSKLPSSWVCVHLDHVGQNLIQLFVHKSVKQANLFKKEDDY